MLLKQLEIKGFKSFAEKVSISFDTGVTGIVGPNGCGKSNVVDAIRWVLGEQRTKNLRSDKMENVIFNGTKQKNPSNTAQVSLTFENDRQLIPAEYSQVTITRRYHRSGESEYLINEVRCRLKDIQNLFLDTGIGSDSYAIIELAKVDEILNDKENARRNLFEKAAGISKFKKRKKESLLRLEAVDKDLDRVGDLLFEIEKNLRSLERQAKQAQRFFKLKENYKKASLLYAKKTITRQSEALQNLRQQLQNENTKRQELQMHIRSKESHLIEEKKRLEHFEQAYQHKQKQLQEHKSKLQSIEHDKNLKKERLNFLEEKNNRLHEQIKESIDKQIVLRQDLDKLKTERTSIEKLVQEKNLELEELKEDYDFQKVKTSELQQKLNAQESLHRQKEQHIFQLEKDFEILQTRLSASKQELEKTRSGDTEQKATLTQFDVELEKINTELRLTEEELATLEAKEKRKQKETQDLEEEVETQRKTLNTLKRELDAKQNEHKLTKDWIENMEGFPEALKFLKNENNWSKNFPLLSDIVYAEDKYQVAIENFLEPYLNYYVVSNPDQAYQGLMLLREAEKGKANFFVLDSLDADYQELSQALDDKNTSSQSMFFGGLNPDTLYQKDEKIVKALDIVGFKEGYASLVYFLLENVFIVEDESHIQADKTKAFITLSGNVIRRQYSLSGGSLGSFEGKKLGRLQNLDNLAKAIEKLQKEVHQKTQDLDFKSANLKSLKTNQTFREAIRHTRQELAKVKEAKVALQSKKEQLGQIIQSNYSHQSEVKDSITAYEELIEEIEPKIQEEQSNTQNLHEQMQHLKEDMAFEQEELTLQSSRFNEKNIAFHQDKNRLENYEQELNYKQEDLSNLKVQLEKRQTELQKTESDLEYILENQENNEEVIESLKSQTTDFETNLQSVEKDYYTIKGDISAIEENIKKVQKQRENQDFVLQELQNKIYESNLSLSTVKERLSVEFGIQVENLFHSENDLQEDENDFTEEDLKNQAEDLRGKIERLGTINPMAMEAFKEAEERHKFISEQKADLEKSKHALLQTIQEAEDYAKNAFMTAYEAIRANFIKVFRSLFSEEDNADLALSDPEHPLESKIEIIAQPKGKRPLTINQLSGGEKTLTATSLLFALYLLKPAPFCIFDEVDAPLDDANTDKFNNIIKQFSKESQFIIVTHNKRTMASTDIMYGVTMLKQGVSSVVPVDLKGLNERVRV